MTSSTGAAVRLHRNVVRHQPESLSAFEMEGLSAFTGIRINEVTNHRLLRGFCGSAAG